MEEAERLFYAAVFFHVFHWYRFAFPLSLSASLGYNFITGNGEQGPGTLFPLFYQFKLYYRIK